MRKYEYRIHTEFKQFDVIQEFDCEANKVQDYIRRLQQAKMGQSCTCTPEAKQIKYKIWQRT